MVPGGASGGGGVVLGFGEGLLEAVVGVGDPGGGGGGGGVAVGGHRRELAEGGVGVAHWPGPPPGRLPPPEVPAAASGGDGLGGASAGVVVGVGEPDAAGGRCACAASRRRGKWSLYNHHPRNPRNLRSRAG